MQNSTKDPYELRERALRRRLFWYEVRTDIVGFLIYIAIALLISIPFIILKLPELLRLK
jgi:hypothetical protein